MADKTIKVDWKHALDMKAAALRSTNSTPFMRSLLARALKAEQHPITDWHKLFEHATPEQHKTVVLARDIYFGNFWYVQNPFLYPEKSLIT